MAETDPDRAETLLAESRFAHALARALLRDDGLAHDVAQDAMLAAIERDQPPRDQRSWLAGVVRRLGAAARRRERERSLREPRAARPEAGDGEARTAARLRLHRALCDAVLALPEPYRTVVTRRYLDDEAPRAIARALRRDVVVVRQQLSRGLAMLRQRLDREFGDRGGWVGAFATCGLGGAGAGAGGGAGAVGAAVGTGWLLAEVLAMKKMVLAAAVIVLGLGAVWWSQRAEPVAPHARNEATGALAAARGDAPPPRGTGTAAAAMAGAGDSESGGGATRQELAFAVRVVDEDDEPFAAATVRCWPAAGGTFVERTGDDGRATFAPGDGAGSGGGAVRVEADGRPPVLHVVDALLGEHRVVLQRGAELTGRVLVDGHPAPAGLRLTLNLPTKPHGDNVPAAAARWLPVVAQCETRTRADGTFAFAGLAPQQRVTLELPGTHWIVPQPGAEDPRWADMPNQLRGVRPQDGLLVVTTQLPTIAGRVVWDDSGAPVPYPRIDAVVHFDEGRNSTGSGVRGEADGTFAFGVHTGRSSDRVRWLDPAARSGIVRCDIDVAADGSEHAHLSIPWPAGVAEGPPQDLVVRLPRAAIAHFLVVDAAGAPIAGARVQAAGVDSDPTGGDGRGIAVAAKPSLVGAPGCLVTRAVPREPAAGTRDDPFVFVLQPRNELRIRLRTPDGDVPAARRVRLSTRAEVFAGARMPGSLDRAFGDPQLGHSRSGRMRPDGSLDGITTIDGTADEYGVLVLHSLNPGATCTIAALDAVSRTLVEQEVELPAPGATREVDLVVDAAPRSIRGRVTDEAGRPLQSASIRVHVGGFECGASCWNHGSFAITDCYSDLPLRVVATCPGFAPQQIEGLTRERDGALLEFRLQPGRTVRVSVRDDEDRIVPVGPWVTGHGSPQHLEPGVAIFHDLPPRVVAFCCTFGGRTFSVEHDATQPEAVLRVPVPARATIAAAAKWHELPPNGSWFSVLVTPLDRAAEPFHLVLQQVLGKESLFVPGRYRFELVLRTRRGPRGPGQRIDVVPQGPAAEVTLRAGEPPQRVELR